MAEVIYKDESFAIMGAWFEVYNEMGCGFVEPVYQECLAIELADRGIVHTAKQPLRLAYKGRTIDRTYQPDFICFQQIVLEIKAVSEICDRHRAQVHNYLKATGLRLGILVNFGHHPKLYSERIVR